MKRIQAGLMSKPRLAEEGKAASVANLSRITLLQS